MTILLVLPIIIPLAAGIAGMLTLNRPKWQRWAGLAGSAATTAAAAALFLRVRGHGMAAGQMGDWPAPFGITLAADLLGSLMVLVASGMTLVVAAYSSASIDAGRIRQGYYTLMAFLLMGVNGAFLTGDLFNLYVWFEVMLIASFVLLVVGGERAQLEGAIKYVTMNLVASMLFLTAVGILYRKTGTLNMADLAVRLPELGEPRLVTAVACLFLVSFGIKAGAYPLFGWLPASYHTPPIAVTALFSALLTKAGVYALFRLFTLVFTEDRVFLQLVIGTAAALTMVTGVLGAVAQYDVRRLLSFHIISQIGYLLMGLALFSPLGYAASLFFMVHVIIAKAALFLVSGTLRRLGGTYDLRQLGGMYAERPALAVLFLVPALALAGIPPLSGFAAKFALVRAGLVGEAYALVAVALGVSILTLYSMIKIWNEAFWKPAPAGSHVPAPGHTLEWVPAAVLAGLTVVLGIAAEPLYRVAAEAGNQLADPAAYVAAVMGVEP